MLDKRLRVELLGAPRVFDDGEPLAISRKRVRAILCYLVAERTPVSRASLAWMLWPDKDSATANRNLSIHVSYLKNATCEDVVDITPLEIGISPHVESDIADFFRLAAADSDDDTIAVHRLFRGDFLEGFTLKGAEPFNQWIETQRARWSERRDAAALETAHILEKRGIYDTALSLIEEALGRNPTCEQYCRQAMSIAAKAQLGGVVKRLFSTLRTELERAYGASPSLQTEQCYHEALGESVAVGESVAHEQRNIFGACDAPFIGRDDQLGTLLSAGGDALALAIGKSGMGKTRILSEVAKSLDGLRLSISFARRNTALPFASLAEALRQADASNDWRHARNEALASFDPADASLITLVVEGRCCMAQESQPQQKTLDEVQYAFERFFRTLASTRPVHFFMDDIQYADEPTLALLERLIGNASMKSCRFAASISAEYFGPHAPRFLNNLKRKNQLSVAVLDALDAAEIAGIISQYYPSLDEGTASRLASLAQGSPLWMKGIIREIDLGHQEFTNSETADTLLNASISQLSANARNTLLLLAATGAPLEIKLVETLCGRDKAQAALKELVAFGFIRHDPLEAVWIPNGIIRTAAMQAAQADPEFLPSTHLRIARAMEAAWGEEPAGWQDIAVCHHYRHSTRPEECGIFASRSANFLTLIGDVRGACRQLECAQAYLDGTARIDASLALFTLLVEQGRVFEGQFAIVQALRYAEKQGLASIANMLRTFQEALGHSAFATISEGGTPRVQVLDDHLKQRIEQAVVLSKSPEVSPLMQACAQTFRATELALEGHFETAFATIDKIEAECRVERTKLGSSFLARIAQLRNQVGAMREKNAD